MTSAVDTKYGIVHRNHYVIYKDPKRRGEKKTTAARIWAPWGYDNGKECCIPFDTYEEAKKNLPIICSTTRRTMLSSNLMMKIRPSSMKSSKTAGITTVLKDSKMHNSFFYPL